VFPSLPIQSKPVTWACEHQSPFHLQDIDTARLDDLFSPDDDPSTIVNIMNFALSPAPDLHPVSSVSRESAPLYFSLLDTPRCYSTTPANPPLIIDTGASVCISPLKSDFTTYQPSTMKIKDLSSSNTVAGEGLIEWHVLDTVGNSVTLALPGYHIPTAEVRLLSPQIMLHQLGGYCHQTSTKIQIHLGNGYDIDAQHCTQTRLPMLCLANNDCLRNTFLASTFKYTSHDALAYPTLLSETNMNLTAAQKEVLLWHHKLSHASISWIQLLMRDRKWLRDKENDSVSLHS
jgi:hypothetical protein